MVISDLNHLEIVAEASNVIGGGAKPMMMPKPMDGEDKPGDVVNKFLFFLKNNQSNTATINQEQNVNAVAFSKYGSATAIAVGGDQTATVTQLNVAAF